jgi:hypothetical protein
MTSFKMKIMKKNMKRMFSAMALLLSMTGLSSCGGAGVVDPLSLFSAGTPPQLDPIVAGLNAGTFVGSAGYTSAAPFWTFQTATNFGGLAYLAPADGIVIGSGPISTGGISGMAVTIGHAGKLATRFIGVQPTVRIGDSVLRGQTIGTLVGFTTNQVAFQVLLDGTPVCPLTFLSANFRNQVVNYYGLAGFLCQ